MSRFKITITGKGLQPATVRKLVEQIDKQLAGKASVSFEDASPPESRQDRFNEAIGMIADARTELETLAEELESWKDNLPENLQDGEKGQELDDAISTISDAVMALEDVESTDVTFPSMY